MKYIVIIGITSLLAVHVSAQSVVSANASLESVVIFTSGVEMKHKAKANLPAGSSELVINGVANSLDEPSIQLGSTANVTIMSVSFSRNYLKKGEKTPAYKRVEDSISLVKKSIDKIAAAKKAEQSILDLLEDNNKIGGTAGISVAELSKMADFYKAKQLEVSNNLFALADKEKEQRELLTLLSAQLNEWNADPNTTSGQLVVQLMAKQAAITNFNLTYFSPKASWEAFYDLRADNTNGPLKISYKANVVQNTGIDWKMVKLTLSTGNPTANSTAPFVAPWFMRYVTSGQLARFPVTDVTKAIEGAAPGIQTTYGDGAPGSSSSVRIRGVGSLSGASEPLYVVDGAPYLGDISAINPDDIENLSILKDASSTSLYGARGANGVVIITTKSKNLSNYTTLSENQLDATFSIDIPYDIMSNAKPHSVSLKEFAIPVRYKYFAAPKLDKDVFLVAEVTDYQKLNLLPGNANIIFENMFVGKSLINPNTTMDTLRLSMGTDKKVIVTRDKVVEQSGVKFFGSNRKQTVTYEIKVRNGKNERVKLAMQEPIPISTDNTMDVELLESSSADVNKDTNILTWNLDLAPGETKILRVSYAVKYPRDKVILGL